MEYGRALSADFNAFNENLSQMMRSSSSGIKIFNKILTKRYHR